MVIKAILLPHAFHTQYLSLAMPASLLARLLPSLSNFPVLHTVKAQFTIDNSPPLGLDLFRGSTNIGHLEFTSDSEIGARFEELILPFSQMQCLNLGSTPVSMDQILEMLPQCPPPVNCTLAAAHEPATLPDGPRAQHTLQHLQSLRFKTLYSTFVQALLESVTVPALKTLALWFLDQDPEVQVQNTLAPFFQRCGCPLKQLNLVFHQDYAAEDMFDDIEALLDLVPGLEELVLPPSYQLPDTVFRRMARGELVPRLEAIDCTAESFAAATSFLEQRMPLGTGGSALQSYQGVLRAKIASLVMTHGSQALMDDIVMRAEMDDRDYVFIPVVSFFF